MNRQIATLFRLSAVGIALLITMTAYWQIWAASSLADRRDNARLVYRQLQIKRGLILASNGKTVLAHNKAERRNGLTLYTRRYPYGPLFAHAVGYNTVGDGRTALELAENPYLTASNSDLATVISNIGSTLRGETVTGDNVITSLSVPAQRAAQKGLDDAHVTGAVVAIEPRTGRVVAMYSSPSFNPTKVDQNFSKLSAKGGAPLLNRATQGLYVPGSVFKIVTAIAGLGSGAVQADTTFPEQPKAEKSGLVVSGFRIHEHAGVPSRSFDLDAATEWSSNIWYALAGLRTGGQDLTDIAGRMGFGQPIPFDLPTVRSQVSGGASGPGGFADDVELANASYGQAKTQVTPLQMAMVAATVANGGILMQPHLVIATTGRGGTHAIGPTEMARVINPADAAAIAEAMQGAV